MVFVIKLKLNFKKSPKYTVVAKSLATLGNFFKNYKKLITTCPFFG